MKKHLLLTCFCFCCFLAEAQLPTNMPVDSASAVPAVSKSDTDPSESAGKPVFRKNNVQLNLSSLALKNYSFSYERSLTRKISFVAGYRFMPATSLDELPLIQKFLKKDVITEEDVNDLADFSASNKTVTGEFRFYGGKKPGARGFYLSLYGRYMQMQVDYQYDYETAATYDQNGNRSSGRPYQIPLKSDSKGLGGGLMIGAQWLIAKRVVLDWYILGGHYGKLKGDIDAAVDLSTMSADEKADLQQDLESLIEVRDTRYITNATVTDQGVKAKVDAPFVGIRGAGISLGIAF